MSFECVDIVEKIRPDVDENTRRLIGVYINLQYQLIELTGTVHTDEDHTLDTCELSLEERVFASSIRGNLRAIRRLIGARYPELADEFSLASDHQG